jgi:hypothetical protein
MTTWYLTIIAAGFIALLFSVLSARASHRGQASLVLFLESSRIAALGVLLIAGLRVDFGAVFSIVTLIVIFLTLVSAKKRVHDAQDRADGRVLAGAQGYAAAQGRLGLVASSPSGSTD